MSKIAIVGDGGWGTALAIELFKKGFSVSLWGAFKEYVDETAAARENVKFLKGVKIPRGIEITADYKPLLKAEITIFAVPSQYLRSVLKRLEKIKDGNSIYVSAVKGIENNTLMRMSEVMRDILGEGKKIAAISGPTIAVELARGLPTTIVVSSEDAESAKKVQGVLAGEHLRAYTSEDIIGVELGGSLKNIVAIAAGISDALGFGANTKAALLTRGLAEITRLGAAMGAKRETFAGLSGIGDLITTCISPYSRNRWFGEMLGKGKRADAILKETEMAIEGAATVKSAYELSRRHNAEMPITREVYDVIYGSKKPEAAVRDLMKRSAKPEHY